MRRLLLFSVIFCALAFQAVAGSRLYNGVVASVAEKVITWRDVEFYLAVEQLKEGAKPQSTLSFEEKKRAVQKVAIEEMVFLEMKSFRLEKNETLEAEKMLRHRKTTDSGLVLKRIYDTYGKTEKDVLSQLARTIEVDRFLKTKIDTLTPVVTDSEVERFYSAQTKRYPVGDLQTNRKQIIEDLKEEKMKQALEEWVQTLRTKYKFVHHLAVAGDHS